MVETAILMDLGSQSVTARSAHRLMDLPQWSYMHIQDNLLCVFFLAHVTFFQTEAYIMCPKETIIQNQLNHIELK